MDTRTEQPAGAAPAAVLFDPFTLGAPPLGLLGIVLPLWHVRWRLLVLMLVAAVAGYLLSLLQPMMFSGRASFVVQQAHRPSQSVVASALPALAGLVAPGASQAELHVSLLQSQTVTDRILDRFELQQAWSLRYRVEARRMLARRVGFTIGRRDNLVRIEVLDTHPQRAAAIANQYVEELRIVLRGFALEEARERRRFYDAQLERARENLATAQQALQRSGYDAAALRAEPRAAAEGYARMRAEVAAAEVRLAATRRNRSDSSAEVQQQLAEIAALRAQLARMEAPRDEGNGGFVARLREFRYAEALVESLSRQAEAARVDEAAEAVPVQWVDQALVPEWPSSPRRLHWVLGGAMFAFAACGGWALVRHRMALARLDPLHQDRLARIRAGLPGR